MGYIKDNFHNENKNMKVIKVRGDCKEKIIEQMKAHYKKYESITTGKFEKNKETYSIKTVKKDFGSWSNTKV